MASEPHVKLATEISHRFGGNFSEVQGTNWSQVIVVCLFCKTQEGSFPLVLRCLEIAYAPMSWGRRPEMLAQPSHTIYGGMYLMQSKGARFRRVFECLSADKHGQSHAHTAKGERSVRCHANIRSLAIRLEFFFELVASLACVVGYAKRNLPLIAFPQQTQTRQDRGGTS